jgi:hypothetical protein
MCLHLPHGVAGHYPIVSCCREEEGLVWSPLLSSPSVTYWLFSCCDGLSLPLCLQMFRVIIVANVSMPFHQLVYLQSSVIYVRS